MKSTPNKSPLLFDRSKERVRKNITIHPDALELIEKWALENQVLRGNGKANISRAIEILALTSIGENASLFGQADLISQQVRWSMYKQMDRFAKLSIVSAVSAEASNQKLNRVLAILMRMSEKDLPENFTPEDFESLMAPTETELGEQQWDLLQEWGKRYENKSLKKLKRPYEYWEELEKKIYDDGEIEA